MLLLDFHKNIDSVPIDINYFRVDKINGYPLVSAGHEDEKGNCVSFDIESDTNFSVALLSVCNYAEHINCKVSVYPKNQEFIGTIF